MNIHIRTYKSVPYNITWLGDRESGYRVQAMDVDMFMVKQHGKSILRLEIPATPDPEGLCDEDKGFMDLFSFFNHQEDKPSIIGKSGFDGAYIDASGNKVFQLDFNISGEDGVTNVDAITRIDSLMNHFLDATMADISKSEYIAYDPDAREKESPLGAVLLAEQNAMVDNALEKGFAVDIESLRHLAHVESHRRSTLADHTVRINRGNRLDRDS